MIDPWAKAAECQRALELNLKPERRAILIHLRKLWIDLANDRAMGVSDWETFAESAIGLHADAIG